MPATRSVRKARTSKLLVVDTSVMRAAGAEGATDPAPANARDALKAILSICHRVCDSTDLREERKRHQSKFAKLWFTQMHARRKVVVCEPHPCNDILADIRSFHSTTQSDIAAVEKDIHLIAAALATDRTVLSGDNRVAVAIRKVCTDTRTVTSKAAADVLWINPITDRDALHAWLSEMGPAQQHWRLGVTTIPPAVAGGSGGRPTQRGKR
jgi:hypothetical protein